MVDAALSFYRRLNFESHALRVSDSFDQAALAFEAGQGQPRRSAPAESRLCGGRAGLVSCHRADALVSTPRRRTGRVGVSVTGAGVLGAALVAVLRPRAQSSGCL